ncbi:MAG: NifU family protein [Bacteroidia bacterium]|nr:NifU family protein [Bacteroidia bacterium]
MQTILTEKVNVALDSIRDYLKSDGGDVRIHAIREDMVLELELLGNCENCSMSGMTLKAGIEEVIKRHVPEIVRVEAVKKTTVSEE